MKYAVLTGASSGIGLEICKSLVKLDYKVFSVSRNPEECTFSHPHFHLEEGDLLDQSFLNQWVHSIRGQTENKLDILVHSAGFGLFKPLESIKNDEISKLTQLHLVIPMQLTKSFLHDILSQKGFIFALGSHSGSVLSHWSGPYAVAKAALHHFMHGLFEDYRNHDLKVCTIKPDISHTPLFDHLEVEPSKDPFSIIDPKEIAGLLESILTASTRTIVSEVYFRPQKLHL